MEITIKRIWRPEENKYVFRAHYSGVGGSYHYDCSEPSNAIQGLIESGAIAGFIFADTMTESERSIRHEVVEFHEAMAKKLRKENTALRREIKELKGKS
jgi:hypothetical protein